jgi:hypothetical protein
MGYQIVSILLNDGRRFDQVVVTSGRIAEIKGMLSIPFSAEQIQDVVVTHDKWDFSE